MGFTAQRVGKPGLVADSSEIVRRSCECLGCVRETPLFARRFSFEQGALVIIKHYHTGRIAVRRKCVHDLQRTYVSSGGNNAPQSRTLSELGGAPGSSRSLMLSAAGGTVELGAAGLAGSG